MAPEELVEAVRQRPFEPFRLAQTNGAPFDIRHAEILLVGRRRAIIGLPTDPALPLSERTIPVDLLHVVRKEPLPASSQTNEAG